MFTKGLTNGYSVIASFVVLALTWGVSDAMAPFALEFAETVRRGFTVDAGVFSFYVQKETLLVRATLYYGYFPLLLVGYGTICLWHMRWWTVMFTALLGILWIDVGVFVNALAMDPKFPSYPDSLYWCVFFFNIVIIGVCMRIYGELGSEDLTTPAKSPA